MSLQKLVHKISDFLFCLKSIIKNTQPVFRSPFINIMCNGRYPPALYTKARPWLNSTLSLTMDALHWHKRALPAINEHAKTSWQKYFYKQKWENIMLSKKLSLLMPLAKSEVFIWDRLFYLILHRVCLFLYLFKRCRATLILQLWSASNARGVNIIQN